MKYTEKQIEKFKEMLRNGALKQLEEYEHVEIIDNIIEIDEATILASCNISTEGLVDIADICSMVFFPIPRRGVLIMRKRFISSSWFDISRRYEIISFISFL